MQNISTENTRTTANVPYQQSTTDVSWGQGRIFGNVSDVELQHSDLEQDDLEDDGGVTYKVILTVAASVGCGLLVLSVIVSVVFMKYRKRRKKGLLEAWENYLQFGGEKDDRTKTLNFQQQVLTLRKNLGWILPSIADDRYSSFVEIEKYLKQKSRKIVARHVLAELRPDDDLLATERNKGEHVSKDNGRSSTSIFIRQLQSEDEAAGWLSETLGIDFDRVPVEGIRRRSSGQGDRGKSFSSLPLHESVQLCALTCAVNLFGIDSSSDYFEILKKTEGQKDLILLLMQKKDDRGDFTILYPCIGGSGGIYTSHESLIAKLAKTCSDEKMEFIIDLRFVPSDNFRYYTELYVTSGDCHYTLAISTGPEAPSKHYGLPTEVQAIIDGFIRLKVLNAIAIGDTEKSLCIIESERYKAYTSNYSCRKNKEEEIPMVIIAVDDPADRPNSEKSL